MPSDDALDDYPRNPCIQCKMPPRINETISYDLEKGHTHFQTEIRCQTHACGYGAGANTKKRWYTRDELFKVVVDRFNDKNRVYNDS